MPPRRSRTRSEVASRDQIARLLEILKIVNEVIRTAEGRLIELFRPPPLNLRYMNTGYRWRTDCDSLDSHPVHRTLYGAYDRYNVGPPMAMQWGHSDNAGPSNQKQEDHVRKPSKSIDDHRIQ